jgi:hypothetical protein
MDKVNEENCKMNLTNQPLELDNIEDNAENWIIDLKCVYDIYQQLKLSENKMS